MPAVHSSADRSPAGQSDAATKYISRQIREHLSNTFRNLYTIFTSISKQSTQRKAKFCNIFRTENHIEYLELTKQA
jgi:hypothetical protein